MDKNSYSLKFWELSGGAKVKFEIIKERTYINGGVENQEENK